MRPSFRRLAPDLVIAARVALAFVAIWLLSLPTAASSAGVVLIVVVISMDALDGYLARRLGVADDLGAVLDITGDRIVEHVFWIYFAVVGVAPLWVPLVIVTRSFAVDTVRGMALADGKTAFGEKTMMRSDVTRLLVSSRLMRNVYGGAKVGAFVLLGAVVVLRGPAGAGWAPTAVVGIVATAASTLVFVTVALNLLRGLPVLWDSLPMLRARRNARAHATEVAPGVSVSP